MVTHPITITSSPYCSTSTPSLPPSSSHLLQTSPGSESGVPHPVILKQVKRGYRTFATAQVCGVSFERLPAWLWILRLVEWSIVILSESDDTRLRQIYPALHNRFRSRWRVARPSLNLDSLNKLMARPSSEALLRKFKRLHSPP